MFFMLLLISSSTHKWIHYTRVYEHSSSAELIIVVERRQRRTKVKWKIGWTNYAAIICRSFSFHNNILPFVAKCFIYALLSCRIIPQPAALQAKYSTQWAHWRWRTVTANNVEMQFSICLMDLLTANRVALCFIFYFICCRFIFFSFNRLIVIEYQQSRDDYRAYREPVEPKMPERARERTM